MRKAARRLGGLVLAAAAFLAGPVHATEIFYKTGWARPHAHFEEGGRWTQAPGTPMQSVGGGWWRATTPGTVGELLFNDGAGNWDHAPRTRNYRNEKGLAAVWVQDGALTYAPPAAGKIESHNFTSRILSGSRRMYVYLPAEMTFFPQKRYPVLYMHDGQNLFDRGAFFGGWQADAGLEAATRAGDAASVIIVGVENSAFRMGEYTPTADARYGGGDGERYLDFLEREVKPFVDGRYRTLTDAASTGIGGSSLGGLISLHAGMTRPHVFGRVMGMSPSLWWDGREMLERTRASSATPPGRLYLDSGGDQDGRANCDEMRDVLAAKGKKFGVDLFHWVEPRHVHNEAAWRERFPRALSFVYPAK